MTGPGGDLPGGPGPRDPGPRDPGPRDPSLRDPSLRDPARVGAGPGWRPARPEILIAAAAVAATAAAGYAVAGPGAAAAVVVAAGVISLVVLYSLVSLAVTGVVTRGCQRSGPGGARAGAVVLLAPVAAAVAAGRRPGLDDRVRGGPARPAGAPAGLAAGRAARDQPLRRPGGGAAGVCPRRSGPRQSVAVDRPGRRSPGRGAGQHRRAGPASDQPGIPFRTLARLLDRLEHL